MAGQTGGGKQIVGFLGIGINYFRSPKFIEADGGWDRVVWMPKNLKDKVLADIPEGIVDKVATEEDAADLESLKAFLKEKDHPILERWVEEEEEEDEAVEETAAAAPTMQMPMMAAGAPMAMPAGSGGSGVKMILKNAKVSIDRVIIKKSE